MKKAFIAALLVLAGCTLGITVSNAPGSLDDCVGVACRK